MLLCQQGQGKVLYRYALAIACAGDGDEMPIKKPEFDEGRTLILPSNSGHAAK